MCTFRLSGKRKRTKRKNKNKKVDKQLLCDKIAITVADKSIDEEEYILFRMNREKVVGENFREGSMEVAFEP